MKDHDVTWLYGPLQQANVSELSGSRPKKLGKSDSFIKKPILKKRSVSEVMLQRSLSNLTLIKRAVDALHAQGPSRPTLGSRSLSDYHKSSPPSVPPETPSPLFQSSNSTSDLQTPSGERRRIHFSEKVDQCIAVDKHAEDQDDYFGAAMDDDDDDSSDDGVIMMMTERGKERKLNSRNGTPRGSFSSESATKPVNKTIAMLPSTKLRGDTPEPPEDAVMQQAIWGTEKKVVKSSSQETLRPTKPSSNFLIDEEDEEADMSWQPSSASSSGLSSNTRRRSIYPRGGIHISSEEDEEMETRGLRRTPSGMFMPYEEDEDEVVSAGLFGKVVDTVNTARDIAHVIWNVGWRK